MSTSTTTCPSTNTATYAFTNVIANHTIDVSFAATSTPIVTPPASSGSGSGSGSGTGNYGGGGIGGVYNPEYRESINVPLIISAQQSGRAIFNLDNGRKITIYVPAQGNTEEKIKINITQVKLSFGDDLLEKLPAEVLMINNSIFKITATNQFGKPVINFPKNLTITLDLSSVDDLMGTSAYYYDSENNRWVMVPNAMFNVKNNQATFNVNNLNMLSVMKSPTLAKVINYLTPTPLIIKALTTTPAVLGIKVYANGSLIRTPDKRIFAIVNGKRIRIVNLKQLAKYRGVRIMNVKYSDLLNIGFK